jgi:hypothetical protein
LVYRFSLLFTLNRGVLFTFGECMPNGQRNWCLTLNNWSEDEYGAIKRFICGECRYGIIGKETGESGTPHLQCYVQCGTRRTRRALSRVLGGRAHLEPARGSGEQNRRYCSKDGDVWEFGVLQQQGRRGDLSSLLAEARKGATWVSLLETHPAALARYPKFVDRVIGTYGPTREWPPEVYVYWGSTGTGKSRRAFEEASSPYVHSGGSWFDGYQGEGDVIFDDFGGSEFKLTYLLKLLDRYPMRVPVKGGFVNWIPRRVFITSNYSPKEWFPNAKDEHVKALFRRFTKTIQFRRLNEVINEDDRSEVVVL